MPQKLVIPQQDIRPAEKLEIELPANIAERLKRVATEGGHSTSYVVSFLLDKALPPEEASPKKQEPPKPKPAKETASKVA
jgi:hypothetical protein